MPFLGVQPTDTFASVAKQTITGDGSVTYTLTHSVANANDLAVFVNNVRQEPTVAYSASGTSITFTEAIASTDDCYVVYIARTFQTVTAPDNSVNADQLSYPLTNFSSTGIDDNATSTAITIDSSQKVGIGTTSPTNTLVVSDGNDGLEFRTSLTDDNRILSYNRNTSAYTKMSLDAADYDVRVGGTVKVAIGSSGNVGIGTSTTSDAGLVIDAKGNANTSASVRFKSNVDTYLRVARFGAGVDSTITLGNNYNRNSGSFAADNSAYPVHNITFNTDGSMRFGTGAAGSSYPTERMRILSSGGITFNGDTATANALDDYEEGNWLPTPKDNSDNAATFTTRVGYYVKIGRLVYVTVDLVNITTTGCTSTDAVLIKGLPFVPVSGGGNTYHTGIASVGGGVASSENVIGVRVSENVDYIVLAKGSQSLMGDLVKFQDMFSGSSDIRFSLSYYTAA